MARYAGWESIPMAEGGKEPVWPLPSVTPKFAAWSLGGGRPFGCSQDKCERWHAGVDLTGAPQGALVIAPEDALIVGLDKGWTDGTKDRLSAHRLKPVPRTRWCHRRLAQGVWIDDRHPDPSRGKARPHRR